MRKQIIYIKGMHCRSCEILIEDELKKIPNIKRTLIDHRQGVAEIYFNSNELDMAYIAKAIRNAGYELGKVKEKDFISKKLSDYKDLTVSFIVLLVLYIILKKTGLTNIGVGSSAGYSNLFIVLLVGLTAGFSTCMALVGGLVLGISAKYSEKHPQSTSIQKFRPHLFFNLGRIISFFFLGGIVGLIGSVFQLTGTTLGILTIIVGFVMFVLGLQLIQIFPWISSGKFTLPKSISHLVGIKKQNKKEYSHKNSFILGALTFFLPCGFTQAMQLYAISTGKFLPGALAMGIFAIGTTPGLIGVGGLTSIVKGSFAKKFFKFAGLAVISLAFVNVVNGFHLTGWKISLGSELPSNYQDPNVKLENGYQIVRMTQAAYGYNPNSFVIKKGIPVKWIIDAKDASLCSGGILSSKLGIRKVLRSGENIIEFTPKETGEIKFSCLMGMYPGKFRVIENPSPSASVENEKITKTEQTTVSSKNSNAQVIKAIYTYRDDINPRKFTVKANQQVRFEIESKDDGHGCMGTIAIPGLVEEPQLFEKNKTIILEFTPQKGQYTITCAMGTPRGTITVE